MLRKKKWAIISELIAKNAEDSQLDNCIGDLKLVSYSPHLGYKSWLFKYKGRRVVLTDLGNSHFGFYMPATIFDEIIAKIQCVVARRNWI